MKVLKISLLPYLVLLVLSACAGNGSPATKGTADSGALASVKVGLLGVTSSQPTSGNVLSAPNSMVLFFSESALDLETSAGPSGLNDFRNSANYIYNCNGEVFNPVSVTVVGNSTSTYGSIKLDFNNGGAGVPGSTCTLSLSANIADADGNALAGMMAINYEIVQPSSFFISSLSVPSQNVQDSALPPVMQVNFSDSISLDGSGDATAINTASNYSIDCAGTIYNPNQVVYSGGQAVILYWPSIFDLVDGTQCSFAVANVLDAGGNALTGISTANYIIDAEIN